MRSAACRSGTLIPLFGACFTNNTGAQIVSLSIAYTGEQWIGYGGRADQLNFEYSANATDLTTGNLDGSFRAEFRFAVYHDRWSTERQCRRQPDRSQFQRHAEHRQWSDRLDPLDRRRCHRRRRWPGGGRFFADAAWHGGTLRHGIGQPEPRWPREAPPR